MNMEVYFIGEKNDKEKNRSFYEFYLIITLTTSRRGIPKDIKEILPNYSVQEKFTDKNGNVKYFIDINKDILKELDDKAIDILDQILSTNNYKKFGFDMWNENLYNTLTNFYKEKKINGSLKTITLEKKIPYKFNFTEDKFHYDTTTYSSSKWFELCRYKRSDRLRDKNIALDRSSVTISDTINLVITIFDILFTHNDFKLSVRKCRKCHKYFLTNDKNVHYCEADRFNHENDYFSILQDRELCAFASSIRDTYNKKMRTTENKTFLKYLKDLNDNFEGNKGKIVEKLLDLHSSDEIKKEKIEFYHLDTRLSEEYMNKFKKDS